MNIAVTGAGGFLGRHVIAALNQRNLSATLVLRPLAEPTPAMAGHRIVHWDVHGNPEGAFEACGRPDVLIHLAWAGLPNYRSPHHLEEELPCQCRFLKQLVRDGLGRLLVSGTCLEYGMASGLMEENLTGAPCVHYAMAKDALRKELETLRLQSNFQLAWIRIFYLFGEGQASGSLWSQLNAAVLRGDKTFPMSGGEQIRDFLPVSEAADTLLQLAWNEDAVGLINLCSGRPVSVREIVEKWIAENRWTILPRLGVYPYPDYEPMAFWGSRRRLDESLGAGQNRSPRNAGNQTIP